MYKTATNSIIISEIRLFLQYYSLHIAQQTVKEITVEYLL